MIGWPMAVIAATVKIGDAYKQEDNVVFPLKIERKKRSTTFRAEDTRTIRLLKEYWSSIPELIS